jgi:hypothetical protein
MMQINSVKYAIIFLLFSYNVKVNEDTKWLILIKKVRVLLIGVSHVVFEKVIKIF